MTVRRRPGRPVDETVLRCGAGILVGFLLVGTALVLASLALDGSDDRPASAVRSTPSATIEAPSASPTASPSPTATASPRMSEDRMSAFLRRYLATAPSDPAAAWARLTPRFQQASGGFSAYRGFWSPIATAAPSGIFAAPDDRRITYRVRYVYPDGRTFTDSTRLELVLDDAGEYRISGEG